MNLKGILLKSPIGTVHSVRFKRKRESRRFFITTIGTRKTVHRRAFLTKKKKNHNKIVNAYVSGGNVILTGRTMLKMTIRIALVEPNAPFLP